MHPDKYILKHRIALGEGATSESRHAREGLGILSHMRRLGKTALL